MNTTSTEDSHAVAGQVQRPVRPLPAVPFCRVRDVISASMAMALGRKPDDGLYTANQMRAHAAQEVDAERERWATAARLCVDATPEQLPMALDALRDVLRA